MAATRAAGSQVIFLATRMGAPFSYSLSLSKERVGERFFVLLSFLSKSLFNEIQSNLSRRSRRSRRPLLG
jgi:hypothetical protein